MTTYAMKTLSVTAKLLILLTFVFVAAATFIVGMRPLSASFEGFVFSWTGMAVCLAFATLYVFVRRRIIHA